MGSKPSSCIKTDTFCFAVSETLIIAIYNFSK
jgi:hypothetical protein